jgi:protein-disulfide isomerase
LVEYGDYECPHCGQTYLIVKEIEKRLKGRLRFVFRNFPITQIHPHTQQAAEAAEAAAVQGKFWDMHDILYENQQALDYYHLVEYASRALISKDPTATYLVISMPAAYTRILSVVYVAV